VLEGEALVDWAARGVAGPGADRATRAASPGTATAGHTTARRRAQATRGADRSMGLHRVEVDSTARCRVAWSGKLDPGKEWVSSLR
jgi:hypothetical protein